MTKSKSELLKFRKTKMAKLKKSNFINSKKSDLAKTQKFDFAKSYLFGIDFLIFKTKKIFIYLQKSFIEPLIL